MIIGVPGERGGRDRRMRRESQGGAEEVRHYLGVGVGKIGYDSGGGKGHETTTTTIVSVWDIIKVFAPKWAVCLIFSLPV